MSLHPEFSWAFRRLVCLLNGWSNLCNRRRQPKRLKPQENTRLEELATDCATWPPPRPGDTPSYQDSYQAWKRRGQTVGGTGCSNMLPVEKPGPLPVSNRSELYGRG